MLAQGMHNINPKRRKGPFVAINCGALPDNLLESELFGYEEGAFTGARKGGKIGIFEMAHGGTVFLDEIDGISPQFQSRLLRVIQEREIMRIGDDKLIPIDIRIISATKKHLPELIAKGLFREDLYYRLNVFSLNVPPLRERKEDIRELINVFIGTYSIYYNKKVEKPSKKLEDYFYDYSWPGNVRQLQNVIERYVVLWNENFDDARLMNEINRDCMNKDNNQMSNSETMTIRIETLSSIEKQVMEHLISKANGNRERVAHTLGISRGTLWRKLKSFNHSG